MSLRVWLPLNGDLRNQGLNDISVINNDISFVNSGKLGKCAYYDTDGKYITLNNYMPIIKTYTNYSMCAWVFLTNTATDHSTTIISSGNWNHSNGNLCFGFYSYNDGYTALLIPNQNGWNTHISLSDKIVLNTWYHIVITYNGTVTKAYINGMYVGQSDKGGICTNSDSNEVRIGAATYYNGFTLKGKLNDVRIYDHALSEQEIKKIAQGLILHYPLNNRGMGQENLLKNSNFDARYNQSTGWNVAKNGTLLANYWGGYNSGVTNASTVYHAHLKEFNNDYVYEFIKTSDEQWLGIAQGGLQNIITAGKTYTFSWEEYHVNGTNRVATGLYYYKINATSANFHLGLIQRSDIVRIIGKWQKFSYTFVAPNDADYNKSMSWYVYGDYNNNGTFYVRHLKLEEGDKATSWSLNSSDNLYTTLQLNDNKEADISGYQRNGTKIGTFSYNSDTSIYHVSSYFNGEDSAIQVPFNTTIWQDNFTINLWFKKDELGNKSYETLFGGPSGFEMDTRSGRSTTLSLYMASPRGNVYSPFIFGVWYMVTLVNNGVNELYYINGELVKTIEKKSMPSGSYFIGAWQTATKQNFKGQMSDFRIYATALSANDIKELYEYRS